jgi:hypothetical protein
VIDCSAFKENSEILLTCERLFAASENECGYTLVIVRESERMVQLLEKEAGEGI